MMLRTSLPISFFLQTLALTIALTPPQSDASGNSARILQDVLKEISVRQNWSSDGVRFSKLGIKKVHAATGQRFEFRIRFGKSRFTFLFPDERSSWRKVGRRDVDFVQFARESSSIAVLDPLILDGPLELRSLGDERASLSLPMNVSHQDLKRVLVGKGVQIEVRNAKEVSLSRSLGRGILTSGGAFRRREKFGIWSWHDAFCTQFPPVQVAGSVSLRAYRPSNPDSTIKTSFLSDDTVELLPEKCYSDRVYVHPSSIDSIGMKIDKLGEVLSSRGDRTGNRGLGGSLNVKVKASAVLYFLLEIERSIGFNDTVHKALPEWRTKPTAERVWFEVAARVEAGKLKPLRMRKVASFAGVDSLTWSNLLSNISFTKFPSILGPQEALTLDVKW